MVSLKPADIVFSLAGHDKGNVFLVLAAENGRQRLADGKLRKLKSPKLKSPKHLRFASIAREETARALEQGLITDRLIRMELARFRKLEVEGGTFSCRKTM